MWLLIQPYSQLHSGGNKATRERKKKKSQREAGRGKKNFNSKIPIVLDRGNCLFFFLSLYFNGLDAGPDRVHFCYDRDCPQGLIPY